MNIDIQVKRLTLKHVFTTSRNSAYQKNNVFIRIEEDGLTGWGEAAPNVRYNETPDSARQALEEMSSMLKAASLQEYVAILKRAAEQIQGQYSAKAALDMALMDWNGRHLGVPLYRIWGLTPKLPQTSMTIGIDKIALMQQHAQEAASFSVLKIKLGSGNDRDIINALRHVTDQPIRVDANEGWTQREHAIREIEWLAGQGVELIEQPMPALNLEDTAWLRRRSPLPLIADEAFTNLQSIYYLHEAYDGINIKLMKCGGLNEARNAITVARAMDMSVMLGCMVESSLAIGAAAHLAPLVDYVDLDGNLLLKDDPFVGHAVDRGMISLNHASGLGVEPRTLSSRKP